MTNRPRRAPPADRRGFALIVSVLALSSVLITVAAAAAFELADAEQRGTVLEHALQAQGLAEGCAEYALMQLRLDPSYAGGETQAINGSPCTVEPIVVGSPNILETEAVADGSVYRLKITIDDLSTMKIDSWQRVADF